VKIAYILTQFPYFTETFVGREIVEIQNKGHDVEIYSLKKFEAWDDIHEDMRVFQNKVHYSDIISLDVLKSNLQWLISQPAKYLSLLNFLISRFLDNPPEVLKAVLSFPLIAHFARIQSRTGVTHIHSHFARMGATSAFICAQLNDIPFSFTVHAFDIFLGKDDPYLQKKLRECKAVACISHYNINYLMEICPDADRSKFEIIRCGIEASRISATGPSQNEVPVKILSVGSLIEKKGHGYLIKAIGDLMTNGTQNVTCDIIGEGPERKALETIILVNGLEQQITLLGNQTQDVVNSYLEECDIFVLACINARDGDRDGIPVALMEAMARAKPVISTYVSGIPELIKDHENGVLVPERNVPALSTAIAELIEGPEQRSLLGQKAIQTIGEEFTSEQNAQKLLEVFKR
jgi:glycosyltransferase involved in cell wall biosynthesis